MGHAIAVVAYLGPETMLPMTSVVAGVAGVVLMFGRRSIACAAGIFRLGRTRSKGRAKGSRPVSIRGLAASAGQAARPEASD